MTIRTSSAATAKIAALRAALEEIHAVYVGHGGKLPARVRAFIDFLVAEADLGRPATVRQEAQTAMPATAS